MLKQSIWAKVLKKNQFCVLYFEYHNYKNVWWFNSHWKKQWSKCQVKIKTNGGISVTDGPCKMWLQSSAVPLHKILVQHLSQLEMKQNLIIPLQNLIFFPCNLLCFSTACNIFPAKFYFFFFKILSFSFQKLIYLGQKILFPSIYYLFAKFNIFMAKGISLF